MAIDPTHPERIVVAAMHGVPYARGASEIWVWRTADGGVTWTSGPLTPPAFPGLDGTPVSAADAVAGFASDGTPLLATMAGAETTRGLAKGTFLSRLTSDASPVPSVLVYRNTVDSAAGRQVLYDKPWLVVDHRQDSPHVGSLYFSTGALAAALGPTGIGVDWTPLASQVLLAISRDGGRTFPPPEVIADSAFSGHLAVGRAGALEIVYMRLKTRDGGGDAVFHRRSTDGGVTFEPPVAIATVTGDTLLELPAVAARPNGDLLACWSQGVRTRERTNQVRCATRATGAGWSAPRGIESALPSDVVPAWPTIVGTERGWYLMLYLVGARRTEVALFRSAADDVFHRVATLSVADGLGLDRFCLATATSCRRTRKDVFSIGDYVALDARAGRLAAAYPLPREAGELAGAAAIHVTTLAEPAR